MKQSNFENKVIEAHTESQAAVQKQVSNPKLKIILTIVAGLGVIVGVIIILRGTLLANSPIFNNNSILNSLNNVISNNSPTTLQDLKVDDSSNTTINWGKNIKTFFTPDYSDSKVWLDTNTSSEKQVGVLDANGNFNQIYSLPLASTLVHLYEDESISFVINSSESKLYVQTFADSPILITALNSSKKFTSVYYNPSEKLFYYSYIDEQGFFHVGATNLLGKQIEIFTSDFLTSNTSIIGVDNSIGRIFLKTMGDSSSCSYINLKDKSLQTYDCASLKLNSIDKSFSTNSNISGTYTTKVRGEIYLTTSDNPNRKIIMTGKDGEVFSALSYHNNYLYFVTSQLNFVSSANYVAKPVSIDKLNLTTFQRTKITDKLPDFPISKIINTSSNLYTIVQLSSQTSELFKYNANGILPASYPASFPVQPKYWQEVGSFEQVRLLNDD